MVSKERVFVNNQTMFGSNRLFTHILMLLLDVDLPLLLLDIFRKIILSIPSKSNFFLQILCFIFNLFIADFNDPKFPVSKSMIPNFI